MLNFSVRKRCQDSLLYDLLRYSFRAENCQLCLEAIKRQKTYLPDCQTLVFQKQAPLDLCGKLAFFGIPLGLLKHNCVVRHLLGDKWLYTNPLMTISRIQPSLTAHVTAGLFKCGLLNNCGGYFNTGYDNNATTNKARKRAIRKLADQHVVELTPLFDLSLYGLDWLALFYLTFVERRLTRLSRAEGPYPGNCFFFQ